jgi:hypothetical protein
MLSWSPTPGKPASFLEGLPGARVREDVMIIKDFTSLPGSTQSAMLPTSRP